MKIDGGEGIHVTISKVLIGILLGGAATAIFSSVQLRSVTSDMRSIVSDMADISSRAAINETINGRQDQDHTRMQGEINELRQAMTKLTETWTQYLANQAGRGGG